jgi:hypothetical protein
MVTVMPPLIISIPATLFLKKYLAIIGRCLKNMNRVPGKALGGEKAQHTVHM